MRHRFIAGHSSGENPSLLLKRAGGTRPQRSHNSHYLLTNNPKPHFPSQHLVRPPHCCHRALLLLLTARGAVCVREGGSTHHKNKHISTPTLIVCIYNLYFSLSGLLMCPILSPLFWNRTENLKHSQLWSSNWIIDGSELIKIQRHSSGLHVYPVLKYTCVSFPTGSKVKFYLPWVWFTGGFDRWMPNLSHFLRQINNQTAIQ